jgi:mannose-6-phosphate isomerase-like protein (cupin superfamily)
MIIQGATRLWPAEPGQVDCFSRDLVTSVETEAMSAHHLRIETGGEFLSHIHDRETEIHFVISGSGQALIGDQWQDIVAGDVALALPGIAHGLRNPNPEPLFILCVFSPPLV